MRPGKHGLARMCVLVIVTSFVCLQVAQAEVSELQP
jgi:hypothetical protein